MAKRNGLRRNGFTVASLRGRRRYRCRTPSHRRQNWPHGHGPDRVAGGCVSGRRTECTAATGRRQRPAGDNAVTGWADAVPMAGPAPAPTSDPWAAQPSSHAVGRRLLPLQRPPVAPVAPAWQPGGSNLGAARSRRHLSVWSPSPEHWAPTRTTVLPHRTVPARKPPSRRRVPRAP